MTRWPIRRWAGRPPPGPFRRGFWRSPLRGPWFTSVLSAALLPGIVLLFLTGLASYAAYDPNLSSGNDQTPDKGLLGSWLPGWPAGPPWLYWVTQGVHVILGLALVPVVLAKLWSVLPRLFAWPPARSLLALAERASLVLLVGGVIFELVTGILNIQYWYAFPFGFYRAHYYGAWVFVAAFVLHVALRLGRLRTALRSRSLRAELRTPVSDTVAEPPDADQLVSPDPAPATISRRGALGMVGAGSLALVALSAGQTVGGAARSTALLAPRGLDRAAGDFQVNRTAAAAGIGRVDAGWRLLVSGPRGAVALSRAELLGMRRHTARLAIACVEGWSTGPQTWSGVALRDLAALAGASPRATLFVESLQRAGGFGSATLSSGQVRAADALLALRVNGADLSADHGYPARVVVPALPGVHNTKWVARLTFLEPS